MFLTSKEIHWIYIKTFRGNGPNYPAIRILGASYLARGNRGSEFRRIIFISFKMVFLTKRGKFID
jgi:hypothetical protein